MPSVEIFLHAICLSEGGARWVGHTHALSANQILCSRLGAEPFMRHLFPDGIVVCGVAPRVIPYVDPGFVLGHVSVTSCGATATPTAGSPSCCSWSTTAWSRSAKRPPKC